MRTIQISILLFASVSVSAQEKTFVKEYTYQASEIDSKVSSRAIATNQLRMILLNEVGVYVESESLLKTRDIKGKFSQDFVETVSTISAGITSLVILDEKWDGRIYWMKASITIDIKEFSESLKQLIYDRQKVRDLQILKEELFKAKTELAKLTKQLNSTMETNSNDSILINYNAEISILSASEFIYKGISKLGLDDFQGAVNDLTEAIKLDPRSSRALFIRGISRMELLDFRGAISDYTAALKIEPKNPEFYVFRGIAKGVTPRPQGEPLDHSDAIADFTKALEFDQENTEALLMRGASKGALQDYIGAIADYTRIIEFDSKNEDAYYSRAHSKAKLKDFRGAISDYTHAIEINSDNARALTGRGASKLNLKDPRGAIRDLTRAIEIDPGNELAYFNRGISRMSLRQIDNGCADLSIAGQLGNTDAYELIRKYCH